jgi:hypothetical protein
MYTKGQGGCLNQNNHGSKNREERCTYASFYSVFTLSHRVADSQCSYPDAEDWFLGSTAMSKHLYSTRL